MNWQQLTHRCVAIGEKAGAAITAQSEIAINFKDDDSPVTNADLASDKVIIDGLKGLSQEGIDEWPILSEESLDGFSFCDKYWCVDPLDGTRDFIDKTGDYTVNIALMENGQPVLGVVHAPQSQTTYFANPEGCWKKQGNEVVAIKVRPLDPKHMIALVSRYHTKQKLVDALATMPEVSLMRRGSAIKLCALADGSADLYPRLTPCCDWDIAAAHCVLRAAGGEIFGFNLQKFTYNNSAPWHLAEFMAVSDPSYDWKSFIQRLSLDS